VRGSGANPSKGGCLGYRADYSDWMSRKTVQAGCLPDAFALYVSTRWKPRPVSNPEPPEWLLLENCTPSTAPYKPEREACEEKQPLPF